MYYADFKTDAATGHTYRHDTRIYLGDHSKSQSSGVCVGAFIGKNPGSASRRANGWGQINSDNTLRLIRSIWLKSYPKGIYPKDNEYVQVLNLFYLCEQHFPTACKHAHIQSKYSLDPTENQTFKKIWWGIGDYDFANRNLSPFVKRLHRICSSKHIFYDPSCGRAVSRAPANEDSCKHPIGLPHYPFALSL